MSEPRPGAAAAVAIAIVAAATLVYYVLPLPGRMRETSWTILFCCGTAALGGGIALVIGRALRRGAEQRLRALITLLCVTVLFFSYADTVVAAIPGQFAELHTKTDALYFSVSTLATVGFGDVHPTGQLARAAVTLQIVFNLVFLGSGVALITGRWRARASSRLAARGDRHPDGQGSGSSAGS